MDNDRDPVIDNSEEEDENRLSFMGFEGLDLLVETIGWVSIHGNTPKVVLTLGKEDWDGLRILHQLNQLRIDSEQVVDVGSL